MKTMAIRLEDDLHAQLTILAQLSNTSIAEIIRASIDSYVENRRNDPSLVAQADGVLAEIDAAAQVRREAIATLFEARSPKGEQPPTKSTGRSRKSTR